MSVLRAPLGCLSVQSIQKKQNSLYIHFAIKVGGENV